MDKTNIPQLMQLAIAVISVLSLGISLFACARLEVKDASMPPLLFVAGLVATGLGIGGLVNGIGVICSAAVFVGCVLLGAAVGLTAKR